ncbi:MAG: NusG domain II-containing protein [Wujia sp.]
MEKETNQTIKKTDLVLIAGLLIVAIVSLVWIGIVRKDGACAHVMVDGQLVKVLPLDEEIRYVVRFEGQEAYTNTVVVENRMVFVEEANCPDKICEKYQPISKAGQTIICLPHKLVVEIRDE